MSDWQQKAAIRREDAAKILSLSPEAMDLLIEGGQLEAIEAGGTTLIPTWSIKRFLRDPATGKKRVVVKDPLTMAFAYVKKSGFPFQTAIQGVIQDSPQWTVLDAERPWRDPDHEDQFLDSVAGRCDGAGCTAILAVETKKVTDDVLVFLEPQGLNRGPSGPRKDAAEHGAFIGLETCPHVGWKTTGRYVNPPSSRGEYCIRGDGRPRLEDDARLLTQAADALMDWIAGRRPVGPWCRWLCSLPHRRRPLPPARERRTAMKSPLQLMLFGLMLLTPEIGTAQSKNDIQVTVDVTVTRDGADYVYDYALTSASISQRPVERFVLEVDARTKVTPVAAPQGWTFGTFFDGPFVSWAATGGIDDTEPDDAPFSPSPFVLRPGTTLRGFKIRSPFPDQTVRFFAEAFVPVPVVEDVENLPNELKAYLDLDFKDRSFSGSTRGPKSPSDCDAQGGDADADTLCDGVDNCPVFVNPDQRNAGGVANLFDPTGSVVDAVGDACQCGDVNDDGRVNRDDLAVLREALAGTRTSIPGDLKCNVAGVPSAQGFPQDCDQVDADALNDILTNGRDIGLMQFCQPAFLP